MTAPDTMTTNCPTPEDLAAFVDGRLEGEARQRMIEHLASCADCRDIVREATLIQTAEDATKVTPFRPRRRMVAAMAAAASIALIAGFPTLRDWITFQRTDGMSAIVKAQNDMKQRTVEARLSGGAAHRELEKRTRGTEEQTLDSELLPLYKAADRLDERRHPRAWAALQLLLGHRDEAVRLMEQVSQTPNPDPLLLNDLAAVYLETGDAKRALELVEDAWAVSKAPEIAWNRALAYQRNDDNAKAIAAWEDYLKLDSASAWAAEARDNLADLQYAP